MENALLDLSFLYGLADNDSKYICDVISLFLSNVPKGLANLEQLSSETEDFDAIRRQAHALKSSAGIIKIRDMYDDLVAIEQAARQAEGKEVILARLARLLVNFKAALPLLEQERDRHCSK